MSHNQVACVPRLARHLGAVCAMAILAPLLAIGVVLGAAGCDTEDPPVYLDGGAGLDAGGRDADVGDAADAADAAGLFAG